MNEKRFRVEEFTEYDYDDEGMAVDKYSLWRVLADNFERGPYDSRRDAKQSSDDLNSAYESGLEQGRNERMDIAAVSGFEAGQKDSAARLEQLDRENAELKRNALGPNPTVAEIVQDYLKRNGYDQMYADGFDYRAGYIQPDGSVGPERKEADNG